MVFLFHEVNIISEQFPVFLNFEAIIYILKPTISNIVFDIIVPAILLPSAN